MKAIVYTAYGPPHVLRLSEVATPTPKDDEVLVRVQAVSVNRSDWEGLTGSPLYARLGGLRRPRRPILGSDIAGRVESVGSKVKRLQVGDAVFGDILGHLGGFAEYVCAPERALALKPAGLSFEEAAALPQAAVIALQGIRDKGQVRPGHKVLINGAGGGAGTFAVQLAKGYGAEVTGVDSAGKFDVMRACGADQVIDYTRDDFTKQGHRYDLILDLVASRSVFAYQRALRPNGRYYCVGGSVATLFQILLLGAVLGPATGKRLRVLAVQPTLADLMHVTELVQAGTIAPMIDQRYRLDEVPEALRYLGAGHAKGKLVITVDHGET